MSGYETRRPLEDMIGDLVAGLTGMPALDGHAVAATGLYPTSVEFALPVETRLVGGPDGLVVHADMPSTRTRTDFDLPIGRFTMRLTATATDATP